jgi:hypothetical protein
MSRRLATVAAAAFAISAISFTIVVWIGDTELLGIDGPRGIGCAALRMVARGGAQSGGPTDTVTLPWAGGGTVEINLPAQVFYRPAQTAEASVTGDAELIRHVRLVDGRLTGDGGGRCRSGGALTVHLAGPAPTAWRLNGSGSLSLSDLDQDTLAIDIRGSGHAEAQGKVRKLSLDVAGSARADLRALAAERVQARIRGSANTDIAPGEEADLTIAGSALVTVHGHPARMRSRVAGSGEIRQAP